MPKFTKIHGVTEVRRLQRLGKIRIGEKKLSGSGKEYPSKLDYFKGPPEVHEIYGEKPRSLDIIFPVEDEDLIFPQAYKKYNTSCLWCTGNGINYSRLSKDQESYESGDCIPNKDDPRGQQCPFQVDNTCKMMANLQFMLPLVPNGLGGVYQIDTSSINSILNVNTAIAQYKGMFHRIAMIPLKLVVVPQETQVKTAKGMIKTVIFVLQIHAIATAEQAKMLTDRMMAGSVYRYEIEPPTDKDFEDMLVTNEIRKGLEHKAETSDSVEEVVVDATPQEAAPPAPEAEAVAPEVLPAPQVEAEPEKGTEETIDSLFSVLEWPKGKRSLYKHRYKDDPASLLKILSSQVEAIKEREGQQ